MRVSCKLHSHIFLCAKQEMKLEIYVFEWREKEPFIFILLGRYAILLNSNVKERK